MLALFLITWKADFSLGPWRWDPFFAFAKKYFGLVLLMQIKESHHTDGINGRFPGRAPTRKVNPCVLLTVCGKDSPLLSTHLVYSVHRQLLANWPAVLPVWLVCVVSRVWQGALNKSYPACLQAHQTKNRKLRFCWAKESNMQSTARR